MLDKLQFYLKHSFNDLRVNGQRTLFALLCIAAGVAAIVSLQTLAAMIEDTLTGNLQENNRGDIVFQPGGGFAGEGVDDEALLEQGVEDGVLVTDTSSSALGEDDMYYIDAAEGIERIRAWAEESYPGQIDITYRQDLASFIQIFFGSGNGTSIIDPESGDAVTQTNPIVIDAREYPFYSEINTIDGEALADVLDSATDVVITEPIAEQLGLEVGDTVRLNGAQDPFTVTGIVAEEVEVKNVGDALINQFTRFYYLDRSAIAEFGDVVPRSSTAFIRIENATPDRVNEIAAALVEEFPYLTTTTTEDLRQNYEDLSAAIGDLTTIMGLVSMLIGSIGIINTMQVIVRRRTVEVAVLKTIGLQANQGPPLFMVEALIMGVIGSLAGIVLGWGAVFVIRGAAEQLVGGELAFQIVPLAAINGFIVGVLVTAVFGFLPTLTAGQVRPGIVLRPSDNIVPRAGILRTIVALVVIILALTLIAQGILGSFQTALLVIVAAFFAVGVLYVVLNFMVWIVGRLFPSMGIVDLKISLRQMLAGRTRAAVTLLALVIGVFSLSVITLFAQTINNLLQEALDSATGGNVAIFTQDPALLPQIEGAVDGTEGVQSYLTIQSYSTGFVSLEKADSGEVLSLEDLRDELANIDFGTFGPPEEEQDTAENIEIFESIMGTIDARRLDQLSTNRSLAAGRFLNENDAGQPVVVIRDNQWVQAAGIEVGDRITFNLLVNDQASGETLTLEVVGLEATELVQIGFDSSLRAPIGIFPESISPSQINVVVDINEENVPDLRREVTALPGVFVFDTGFVTQLVEAFLGTFTAFPTMVALLGLVVGGVVIANSVALTTMERRKEIAVMKAVGLHRERVLGMILLENGVMGLIGGLVGVGIGLVALTFMISTLGVPVTSALPIGTALLLMGLCIIVALLAAMTTAWGASGEKPLNVLRYE